MHSSPHPRGCFHSTVLRHRPERLFPAPAGVFLGQGGRKDHRSALPRTRGGVSILSKRCIMSRNSSPHPRGCFLRRRLGLRKEPLFPAPAGVFPTSPTAEPGATTLPRTRGGVSAVLIVHKLAAGSSPHPRGCFLLRELAFVMLALFPAPAGVFPSRRKADGKHRTLPRTRGGVSSYEQFRGYYIDSSPHPRGCFSSRRSGTGPRRLFPAPAGVFPLYRLLKRGVLPLPRTRGGVSSVFPCCSMPHTSSPHPRGCFFKGFPVFDEEALFPAPAGVFL